MRSLRLLPILFALCCGALHAQWGGKLIFPEESDPQILEWGDETVGQYLNIHKIPPDHISILRTVARPELRDQIRAYAWIRMVTLIKNAAAIWDQLSPAEKKLMEKYRDFSRVLETDAMDEAVAEKNRFRADLCNWQPDSELAKLYNYTYDGSFFCSTPATVWHRPTGDPPPSFPTKAYFVAHGEKKTWVDTLKTRQDGITSIRRMTSAGSLILGIGIPAAVALGVIAAIIMVAKAASVISKIFPYAEALGPAAWIGVGVSIASMLILVAVVIYVYTENQRVMQEQDTLDTELAALRAKPAKSFGELSAMVDNDQDRKLLYLTFVHMVVPKNNLFTPGPLPQAGPDDPKFLVQVPGQATETVVDSITFPTWQEDSKENTKYQAQVWNGWFLFQDLLAKPKTDPATINTRFRYYRDGVPYELDRIGHHFAISKAKPAAADVACPPDPATGVSSGSDFTKCKSYVSESFEIELDGLGRRIVSLTQPAVFISPLTARVAWGTPATLPITISSRTFTNVAVTTSLPSGFKFVPGLVGAGKATISWDGRTNAPAAGVYDIGLRAITWEGADNWTATLKVEVVQNVRFTLPTTESTKTYEIPAGQMVDMWVAATGTNPPPMPALASAVPGQCGLTAFPESNSMLHLKGYLLPPSSGNTCTLTFYAGNRDNSDIMKLVFKVTEPPQPQLATPYFVARPNVSQLFEIRTVGATGPITISLTKGANNQQLAPSYVNLYDRGDGTAQLTMFVPNGAPNRFFVPLWYRVAGTSGNQATSSTDGVTIEVSKNPIFDFYGNKTLVFSGGGGFSTFLGTVRDATSLESSQPLPPGLMLNKYPPEYFRVEGAPTGPCDTTTEIHASNAYGTTAYPVRIVCLQNGKITSADEVNFYLGRNNTFTITGSGYPIQPLPDLDQAYAMRFWVQNNPPDGILPGGLQFSTNDPESGQPMYGRALITGTPTTAGQHNIVLFHAAGNGQTYQFFKMKFVPDGDVNGDWQLNCSDVSFITSLYGVRRGWSNYNYNADYNQDGIIDERDAELVKAKLPAGPSCN